MSLNRVNLDVELDDGSEHHLTILNASMVAWDRTRALRKWPSVEDGTFLWMTFLAWHHMKAIGLVECDFAEFEKTKCVAVSSTQDEAAETDGEDGEEAELGEDVVDPTPPALGAVS
jgi:hypothetical protein